MPKKESYQCTAITQKGVQCKVRTIKTHPKCWVHTKNDLGLRVKKSKIPGAGNGLFARGPKTDAERKQKYAFKKDQKIVEYSGEDLTKAQMDKKYGEKLAPYALRINEDRFVDAIGTKSSVAKYANDCHGTERRCNAIFSRNTHNKKTPMFLKATRNIRFNKEILADYGDDYWKNEKSK